MASNSVLPVPEQPGRFVVAATGQVVQQEQTYEGDVYDTVEFVNLNAGTVKKPFSTDPGAKTLQFSNMTTAKRLPSYHKLKLQRLGVHVRQWAAAARPSPEDVVALYEMAFLRFSLGSTNLVAEGSLLSFPSGWGITGVSTANNFSALANGVASQAAAPRLTETFDINEKMDLNFIVTIGDNTAMATPTQPIAIGTCLPVTAILHGLVTRPLGS